MKNGSVFLKSDDGANLLEPGATLHQSKYTKEFRVLYNFFLCLDVQTCPFPCLATIFENNP